MLSWFRRKARPAPTFKERVRSFWIWFEEVAPRFYATIENGRCGDLAGEVSAKVAEVGLDFAWVFGPGANRQGHSFTLSGEGIPERQLLTLQWLAQAPTVEGWTFHAARQAGEITGHTITIAGQKFDPKEIWVTPTIDAEKEKFDLTLWHPAWAKMERKEAMIGVFLFLDEALGEYGTDRWIGFIELGQDNLAESYPLAELAAQIAETAGKEGWELWAPGERMSLLSLKSPGAYPRGDAVTQATALPSLIQNYLEVEGDLADPLSGTGADFVFVSIDGSYFRPGEQATMRGELEDALDAALKAESSGRCLGGAWGTERSYVDLLLFDGSRSLDLVRQTLVKFPLPRGSMLEFFAREKRGQRVALPSAGSH